MASVTLDTVMLRYPSGTVGLDDVDLHIDDGEFVALVGPSGSGKTTLLRTIAGFLSPTTGSVRIGERIVAGQGILTPPERRGLGMVFQQHAVWPHWNVGRNVDYPLRRSRVPRAERTARVEETLELVGLGGASRRDPATLSGGQRQRVALARALVARPRVLLLDEALSALDEPLRDRLRLELHALTRQLGLTVVHVTHDRSEALALADRVVVLDSGRIQQVGTPDRLVRRPRSSFVARFLSDATLVDGLADGTVFTATGHPLRVFGDEVAGVQGPACAAILPADVALTPDAAGDAIVRSSLYTPSGGDIIVDWAGVPLRVHTEGLRPAAGERMRIAVRRAMVYAGHGAGGSPAASTAVAPVMPLADAGLVRA